MPWHNGSNRAFRAIYKLAGYLYSDIEEPKQFSIMLKWTVIFLIVALIAAIFGFGGIAAGAASIAKILFFIFLVLFIISLIAGAVRR